MKHLQTFESFIELNEATKQNPSDVKEGDLIRWTPRRGNSYFKRAVYGRCTAVSGGEFWAMFIGWSDASKEQPEYAYPDENGSFSGKKDTEVPFSKVNIQKELDLIDNDEAYTLGGSGGLHFKHDNKPVSPMSLNGVVGYLKDVTIWKP